MDQFNENYWEPIKKLMIYDLDYGKSSSFSYTKYIIRTFFLSEILIISLRLTAAYEMNTRNLKTYVKLIAFI